MSGTTFFITILLRFSTFFASRDRWDEADHKQRKPQRGAWPVHHSTRQYEVAAGPAGSTAAVLVLRIVGLLTSRVRKGISRGRTLLLFAVKRNNIFSLYQIPNYDDW
jgi:hypothetical protein